MSVSCPRGKAAPLLQWRFVVRIDLDDPDQRRDALDEFSKALQPQQREAERKDRLGRPQDQAAGVGRHLLGAERLQEEWPGEIDQIGGDRQ